jgi:hypothetical protein
MNFSPLNDACWSSQESRTEALLPLVAAFKDWREWGQSHVKWTVEQITILTIKRIIAEMGCLPERARNQCRHVFNTTTALEAALAAQDSSLWELAPGIEGNREAKNAAYMATRRASEAAVFAGAGAKYFGNVTSDAADAAAYAAKAAMAEKANPDSVLRAACQLWIEAANRL